MSINTHKTMKDWIESRYTDRNIFQVSKAGAKNLEGRMKKLAEEVTRRCCDELEERQRITPRLVHSVLDSRQTMAEIWDQVMQGD